MQNAGLGESQAGIKIAKTNINNLRYADDTTLMVEVKELKSLLMKVKITLMVEVEELKSLLKRVKDEREKARQELSIKKLRSWHLVPSLHGK